MWSAPTQESAHVERTGQDDRGPTRRGRRAEPSGASYRSRVPDLLFEEEQEARIAEILPFVDSPELIDGTAPLHRVTLFVTYRCNLACSYCKTIVRSAEELRARPHKGLEFGLDHFRRLLVSHEGTPIRHLHLTGGEAALAPRLPDMVRLARRRGVARVSITSNGALSADRYRALVDAGIDEIRISIDAPCSTLGQAMTRRCAAWQQTVRNIRALAALRERGAPFFLITNSVVEEQNRRVLDRLLEFLLDLGPDDLKLITCVDEKDTLADFPERPELEHRIERLLAAYPAEAMPLLRRKIRTVFDGEAIGLEHTEPRPDGSWRCYIPLTERTVDRAFYYPCSVYLREGGEPLGRLDEPQWLQRQKSARFVRDGDCLSDPICRRYCLHCTRQFNIRANAARR